MSLRLRTLLETISTPKSSAGRARTRRAVQPDLMRHLQRLEERTLLSTFTVTNTLDNTKTGSLRWAITQVNAAKGTAVETIDFNALGGADNIVVNNLTGTDVTHVAINLADTAGGNASDGQVDTVTVNGTTGGYHVTVGLVGGAVTVDGLSAQVAISHGGNTDQLIVNGLGGDDTLDASAMPANAMELILNGGDGNDTLLGAAGNDLVNGGHGNDVASLGAGDDGRGVAKMARERVHGRAQMLRGRDDQDDLCLRRPGEVVGDDNLGGEFYAWQPRILAARGDARGVSRIARKKRHGAACACRDIG